jgi:hypothetical protein
MEAWHWWEALQTGFILFCFVVCFRPDNVNVYPKEIVEKKLDEEELDELIKRIRDKQL